MQTKSGRPLVKNPLLFCVSQGPGYANGKKNQVRTYSTTPMKIRFFMSRHGNIGIIPISFREINHSHKANSMQKVPEITKNEITNDEFQEYSEFPS